MAIAFECQFCARPHRVDEKYAGKRILCKKCGEAIRVPAEMSAGSIAGRNLEARKAGSASQAGAAGENVATTVQTSCPYCERPHKVDVRYAGRKIKCKKCGEGFRVPLEDGAGLPGTVAREELLRGGAGQAEEERGGQEEAERLVLERAARAESERLAREEAERARAEAERLEAERRARAEAERVAREEAERLAREAAAKAEAQRLAEIEAERKALEEAERIEEERLAREEAERVKQAEAERAAKVEAERQAHEEAERAEAERLAREAAARAEAERSARIEAERKERAEAARVEAERKAREETERQALEEVARLAREEAERVEVERLAREAAKKAEAQRLAKMEAEREAREEAERSAREEAERVRRDQAKRAAKAEAERLAKMEAERQAREEAERVETQRLAREAAAKTELERLAKIEAERQAREEAQRIEAERVAREEREGEAREEAERLAKAEAERVAREEAERQAFLEAERAVVERKRRAEAERAAKAEAERLVKMEAEREAREEAERVEAGRLAEIEAERAASEASRAAEEAALAAEAAAEVERVSGIERLAREQAERREREEAVRKERAAAAEVEHRAGGQAEEEAEELTAAAPASATPAAQEPGDRPAGKGFWGKLMSVWKKPDSGLAAEAGRPVGSTGRILADGPGQSAVPAAAGIARPASAPAAASVTGAPVKDIAAPSRPGVMTVPVIAPIVRTVAPKAVTLQAPVMAEVFHWDAPLPGKEAPAVASVAPGASSTVNVPVAAVARAEGNGAPIDPSSIGTGLDASAGSADEDADDGAGDAPMAILVEDAEAGVVPANASATEVFELEVPETVDVGGTATEATPTEFVPAELLDEPETSVDSGEDWVEGADVEESPAVTLEPREQLIEVAEPEVARAEMPSVIFPRPEAEEEKSAGGSPILRHRPRDSTIQIAPPLTPYLSHITGHIERTIGRAPIIFHELVSVGVHIDLHVIPPTDDPPSAAHPRGTAYFTIVTSGLSTRPMNVPAGCDYPVHAELMICLPVDWPGMNLDGTFDTEKMRDEKNWWPLRWLKAMARMPHEYNTFIGPGHTIPNGANAEPFAVNTALGCMLVQPPLLNPRASRLVVSENVAVQFYALWPIYREELELKQSKGIEALVERFRMAGTSELIQLDRKNVCRR